MDGALPATAARKDIMTKVRYRLSGQAGLIIDCVSHSKMRVVFGMWDEAKTNIAWYVFASKADAATQAACTAKYPGVAIGLWGFREGGFGRDIPHTFTNFIGLDGLADPYPKGADATLDLELTPPQRLIGCVIKQLKTKAGETVDLSFGLQQSSQPPRSKNIKGKVYFLEPGKFDAKTF
jgi:hypothetical protein